MRRRACVIPALSPRAAFASVLTSDFWRRPVRNAIQSSAAFSDAGDKNDRDRMEEREIELVERFKIQGTGPLVPFTMISRCPTDTATFATKSTPHKRSHNGRTGNTKHFSAMKIWLEEFLQNAAFPAVVLAFACAPI